MHPASGNAIINAKLRMLNSTARNTKITPAQWSRSGGAALN
jgi:hypothetical protein